MVRRRDEEPDGHASGAVSFLPSPADAGDSPGSTPCYNKFFGRIWVMKPLNDRVLVKRLESEEKTAGGLFIPDAAKEKPSKGEIVACGPGKLNDKGERVAMEVKPGDVVLFAKYAGTEIKVNGADHIIMREEDILAILD